MKPLEFKIEEGFDSANEEDYYVIVFFYEDGITRELITYDDLPDDLGLELNKHYSIADIYGYQVVDDRKGL